MAHKKGAGSSKNGRDSNSQRRGVKKFGGEFVRNGNIIVRQVGTRIKPGEFVRAGRDYTLYAITDGFVKFETMRNGQKRVSVTPLHIARPDLFADAEPVEAEADVAAAAD